MKNHPPFDRNYTFGNSFGIMMMIMIMIMISYIQYTHTEREKFRVIETRVLCESVRKLIK